MDAIPINFDLIKHPLNWFIVLVMVALPLFALSLVHSKFLPNAEKTSL